MTTYRDLLEKKKELEAQIAAAREKEIAAAVVDVRQLVLDFNLTEQDVFPTRRTITPAKVKYRDPSTGATWTGRGKPPRWIADKDREQYAV